MGFPVPFPRFSPDKHIIFIGAITSHHPIASTYTRHDSMHPSRLAQLVVGLSLLPTVVVSWGAVGHEAVATIAQIHLHEPARAALHDLLPYSNGHLAPIASWADRIRGIPAFHFSGELHYTSPLEDYPPGQCHFGDKGWKVSGIERA